MTAREAGIPTRLVRSNALFCGAAAAVRASMSLAYARPMSFTGTTLCGS